VHKLNSLNPLVSVILPTFNREKTIGNSIKSVLNQTYTNFELIIVDDASEDDTERIVNSIQDQRIRYIKHKKNKGGGAARNTGIKIARGEFIAFQDSDDQWERTKLELQINTFKQVGDEIGVVYTAFLRHKDNTVEYIPREEITEKEGYIHSRLLHGNFITTQTAVVRRECFLKAGMFDERLPRLQDWELWLRISKYYQFKLIDQPLVNVYYTENSISSNTFAYIKALTIILRKHRKEFEKRKIVKTHLSSMASCAFLVGDIYHNMQYIIKKFLLFLPPKYSFFYIHYLLEEILKLKKCIEKQEDMRHRYYSYYRLINQWLKNKNNGKSVFEYFKNNGIGSIAIYGIGEMGLRLYEELKGTSIKISYFIEKNFDQEFATENVKVVALDDITYKDKVDAIVITPIYDFNNIKEILLNKKLDFTIISLEEIVNKIC
jgi:glycosyltransferase involved in cell wall biosynthesis